MNTEIICLLFCRFLHDFYTFIEHMLPAYVADLGYCLLGKRPRYFVRFSNDTFKFDKFYSFLFYICVVEKSFFSNSILPVIVFTQDGEDLQPLTQGNRDTYLLYHAFLGMVV